MSYSQIIQKERAFYEYLFNDIDDVEGEINQSFQFAQIDGVDASLNEIHSLPTQQLNNFSEDSFMREGNLNKLSLSLETSNIENPFLSQEYFFGMNEMSHQNEAIMPWQI